MRKLLSIFAFLCLLFLTAGYHFLYRFEIVEAKQEMKRTLLLTKTSELTKLFFSSEEVAALDWESATEFYHNGDMYDVVKLEKAAGQTIIWCLSDEKETALVHDYLKTQKQLPDNSSGTLLKILSIQYLPSVFPFLPNPFCTIKEIRSPYYCSLADGECFRLTPPPRVC